MKVVDIEEVVEVVIIEDKKKTNKKFLDLSQRTNFHNYSQLLYFQLLQDYFWKINNLLHFITRINNSLIFESNFNCISIIFHEI